MKNRIIKRQSLARRSEQGNMLVLITAVTLGIVLVILLFMMSYMRLLGSQSEQKTAIEAAALAAAREMSKIVIQNNDFGCVGLCDSAPTGTGTTAADTYYTSVHSINTLFGTTLLDYIIANEVGNNEMQALALVDQTKARAAADQLQAALTASIASGGTGTDKDGNSISPYTAAENAYRDNQIRMTGSSTYVAGSLNLQLGVLQGGSATHTNLPVGWTGSFPTTATVGNFYRSYVPINYNGRTWVFAGIGDAVKLVDFKMWQATAAGVPYQHRTIVRAEAVQTLNDNGVQRSIKTVACAQPASNTDHRPAPGALVLSYPDGVPNGACSQNQLVDLFHPTCMADSDDDVDMYYSSNGDYPVDGPSTMVMDSTGWPLASDPDHKASNACKIAIYDWLKHAGTKASVGAVVNAFNTPWNAAAPATVAWPPGASTTDQIPNGIAHIYRFATNGNIYYQSKIIKPNPYYVVSENQTYFEGFEILTNGAASTVTIEPVNLGPPLDDPDGKVIMELGFDVYVRDYARKPGKNTGGKHAGEPVNDPLIVKDTSDVKLVAANSGHATCEQIRMDGLGAKTSSQGGGGGNGSLPLISPQEDFAFLWNGTLMQIYRNPALYVTFATGGPTNIRTTYQDEGTTCEIRFRRRIHVENTVESSVFTPDPPDPETGLPPIDPVSGAPTGTTTTTVSSTANDKGYIGLK
jgi:hypothetical protein